MKKHFQTKKQGFIAILVVVFVVILITIITFSLSAAMIGNGQGLNAEGQAAGGSGSGDGTCAGLPTTGYKFDMDVLKTAYKGWHTDIITTTFGGTIDHPDTADNGIGRSDISTKPGSRPTEYFAALPDNAIPDACKGKLENCPLIEVKANGKSVILAVNDSGPGVTDDSEYVFKNARPKNTKNLKAGLDISDAAMKYLGGDGNIKTDWRFLAADSCPKVAAAGAAGNVNINLSGFSGLYDFTPEGVRDNAVGPLSKRNGPFEYDVWRPQSDAQAKIVIATVQARLGSMTLPDIRNGWKETPYDYKYSQCAAIYRFALRALGISDTVIGAGTVAKGFDFIQGSPPLKPGDIVHYKRYNSPYHKLGSDMRNGKETNVGHWAVAH